MFASGTGNRRHPLFFLSGPKAWLCKKLGIPVKSAATPITEGGAEMDDLATVTAGKSGFVGGGGGGGGEGAGGCVEVGVCVGKHRRYILTCMQETCTISAVMYEH